MATLRRLLVLVLLLGLALVSGSPLAPQVSAQPVSDAPVRLPGHTLAAVTHATKVARPAAAAAAATAAADPTLTLTVVLNRSDEAGFQRFLADVEDPTSPNHGKFLSQPEITRRFGPSQQAYDETLAYLQQQGFTLVEGSANRLTLTVKGTRTQAEKAFALQINDYQLGNRSFFANDQDPAVPGSIAKNIQAVTGLSNLAQPQPNSKAIHNLRDCSADKTKGQNVQNSCLLVLYILVALYLVGCTASILNGCKPFNPPGLSSAAAGAGQKIGLLEYDTFNSADVSAYLNMIGAPAAAINQLSTVAVNGGLASPGPGEAETLLDIDTVMSVASVANVVVYDAPGTTSFQSLFNTMVNDGDTVISNSWSYCEDQTSLADVQSIDAIFANASASGVSIFNASGDSGSSCLDGSANTVGVPADAPHATAVGGTTATIGPGATYGGETWWDGSHATQPTGQGGFGVSRFFPRPVYQDGLTSAATRSVPDVVADADPSTGIQICQADAGGCPDGLLHGGTSMAAPLWAAMGALLNQSQGHNLGNLNPLLYPRANTTAFHNAASMGSDFAHVGLGSPRLDALDIALGGLTVGPGDGAASGVAAIPNTVAADGTSTTTIRVTLVDANNHFLSGKNVTLTASAGSHATLSAASGPSSVDNATVLFTVKDSTIEDVTFTATDTTDGVPIQQTAIVHFVSPAAVAGGIAANPTTVPADGATASTITVTLHDANGQGVSGKTVTLAQGSGHSIVNGPTPATTNSSGQVTFAATDTTTESVTYTAVDVTDGNLPVPGSAAVSFTNGTVSCSNGTPTAATGYAFKDFATGFNDLGTCQSPTGSAFDASGNLLVVDTRTGFLYRFGPQGGGADGSTQMNTTAIPGNPYGLVFGKDGKLYLGRLTMNDILEINPATGAIIRTVTTGVTAPLGMVIDPISGDLFVNERFSGNMVRVANPGSAMPTVTVYASPGTASQLTVAPDGTFFSAVSPANHITQIAGTNAPTPGALTFVANVPQEIGIAVAASGGVPAFLLTNRLDGVITKVDLTTIPQPRATSSPVARAATSRRSARMAASTPLRPTG
jgi:subtilase family serine protease